MEATEQETQADLVQPVVALPPTTEETQEEAQVRDPFDHVLLEKFIDNALLTSTRTMNGLNNTISMSMKIVHNKFTPSAMQAQQVNQKIPARHKKLLYDVINEK